MTGRDSFYVKHLWIGRRGSFAVALLSSVFISVPGVGQQAGAPSPGATSGGVASGVAAAPIYDSQKRPITAGGFVDSGPVVFQDVTKSAGLSGWQHKMGTPEKKVIVETNGSGVCLIDYDNDGWLDIYLVNGSTFDALDEKEPSPHAALFHNNHDGTFTDVAGQAGVANDRWGYGCSVADYTTTAGRIYSSAIMARIGFTTMIIMEALQI